VATSGHDALASLEQEAPRLVVVSDAMPVMNGLELCRRIRKDARWTNLPVILLAGHPDVNECLLGLEAGADGFIAAPFDEETILEGVREVLAAATREDTADVPSLDVLLSGSRYMITAGRRRMLTYLASSWRHVLHVKRMPGEERVEPPSQESRTMAAIGRFAAGVAHDFNNVLQVIQGFTDYLVGKTPAGDAAHGPLLQIRKASDKAAALTQQLLMLSGKRGQNSEVLDLGEVAEGLSGRLRHILGEKGRVELKTHPGLWKVRADRGHLELALMNLAANARDAMEGEGLLTIETANLVLGAAEGVGDGRPTGAGEYVRLVVRDNGTGMSREAMEHLFEPFFTTKEKGKGTGLGLATVYGIVKQAGGSLQCVNKPGKGTEQRILLPRLGEETP
jgi:signal transduction histidine kinase